MMDSNTVYALGFARRKRKPLRTCFPGVQLVFVRTAQRVPENSVLVVWGQPRLPVLAAGVKIVYVEDGFLRSVGLGADWIPPLSWVVDQRGMYFDATHASDLEVILQTTDWSSSLLQRAAELRRRIVQLGLTKYNVGSASWHPGEKKRPLILVPGQVETDASIRLGSPIVRSNLDLLQRVRAANPSAYVIYKPHPDVVAGLRLSGTHEARAVDFCDELVLDAPMHHLLEHVDEVHTMTSLAGFEALLRGCRVVCYGQPFYAGWGLTHDMHSVERRKRKLSLDALVAGTLILYPRYFGMDGKADSTPEKVLDELLVWREKTGSHLTLQQKIWRPVLQLLAWWQDGKRRQDR